MAALEQEGVVAGQAAADAGASALLYLSHNSGIPSGQEVGAGLVCGMGCVGWGGPLAAA